MSKIDFFSVSRSSMLNILKHDMEILNRAQRIRLLNFDEIEFMFRYDYFDLRFFTASDLRSFFGFYYT